MTYVTRTRRSGRDTIWVSGIYLAV